MWDGDETQNGWGEATNLPLGDSKQYISKLQEEADNEVPAGDEENEKILSREKVSQSCCWDGGKVFSNGEASTRGAWN